MSRMPTRREQRKAEAIAYRKWYGTKEWQARREGQLSREPFCAMCEEEGKQSLATVADHVVPHRGDYALFFEGELQSLCSHHHNSVKQSKERTGIRKGFDEEGMPLDKNHPWLSNDRG